MLHGVRDLRFEASASAPASAPDEVLVRVARAGLCGSDLHVWRTGDFITTFPVVPGHEVVGTVVSSAGDAAADLVGRRVVLDSRVPCGRCRWCHAGHDQRCASIGFLGEVRGGGFGELVAIPADRCWTLPDRLPFDVAVLAEPTAVVLHAWARVKRAAQAEPDRVAVLGGGPVGVLLSLLVPTGVETVIVEPNPARAEQAAAITGHRVVAPEEAGTLAGGFDAVFDCAGAMGMIGRAAELARPGGIVGAVALHHAPEPIDVNSLVAREVTLLGSHVFDDEMPAALEILAERPDVFGRVVDRTASLEELPALVEAAASGGAAHLKLAVDPTR